MNESIVLGLVNIIVSGFFLFGAYTKSHESNEVIQMIKKMFRIGKFVYVIFWIVLATGIVQVVTA